MSYLPAVIVAVVGIMLLVVVLVRVLRVGRRFSATVTAVSTNVADRTGTVRARTAALRVGRKELTRARRERAAARVRWERRGRQEEVSG